MNKRWSLSSLEMGEQWAMYFSPGSLTPLSIKMHLRRKERRRRQQGSFRSRSPAWPSPSLPWTCCWIHSRSSWSPGTWSRTCRRCSSWPGRYRRLRAWCWWGSKCCHRTCWTTPPNLCPGPSWSSMTSSARRDQMRTRWCASQRKWRRCKHRRLRTRRTWRSRRRCMSRYRHLTGPTSTRCLLWPRFGR